MQVVSIGIPTFNRPDGLRRTLKSILSQDYPSLEIIVSDNCSESVQKMDQLVMEFQNDPRIRFIRQEKNIGAWQNFKFLLSQASGTYFMWAADDDEWDSEFISTCVTAMGGAGSAMTNYITVFRRQDNRLEKNVIPLLQLTDDKYKQVLRFLFDMQPSLFYGLHRRETILPFLRDDFFDFYDCYFAIRQILTNGFVTLPDKFLYRAGIESDGYVVKPAVKSSKRLFVYLPFLSKSCEAIIKSRELKFVEKIKALRVMHIKVCGWFINFEGSYRPKTVLLVRVIRHCLRYWDSVATRLFEQKT